VDVYSASYLRNLDMSKVRFDGQTYLDREIKKQKFKQAIYNPESVRNHMRGYVDDRLMINYTQNEIN
jgi:hypothetical protein